MTGIVLIGGKSKRMGKAKAFIEYEGLMLFERTAALLELFSSTVYLSGRAEQKELFRESHYPFISDKYEDIGPVAGILSAFEFQNNREEALMVVATDMPLLNENALQQLVQARDKDKMLSIFRQKETKFLEPLCAIYEKTAFQRIKEEVDKGNYAIHKMFREDEMNCIDYEKDDALTNINYPHQWEKLNK